MTGKSLRPTHRKQLFQKNYYPLYISSESSTAVRSITAEIIYFEGSYTCSCCGHLLSISRKQLKDRTVGLYRYMHHYNHPEACPETHLIYRKDTLTPELLETVIEKIEIGHMKKTSKLGCTFISSGNKLRTI